MYFSGYGSEFVKDLAKMIGLEIDDLVGFDLHCWAGDVVRVHATYNVHEPDECGLKYLIKKYTITDIVLTEEEKVDMSEQEKGSCVSIAGDGFRKFVRTDDVSDKI